MNGMWKRPWCIKVETMWLLKHTLIWIYIQIFEKSLKEPELEQLLRVKGIKLSLCTHTCVSPYVSVRMLWCTCRGCTTTSDTGPCLLPSFRHLLFHPAYSRLADPPTCKNPPVSTSHLRIALQGLQVTAVSCFTWILGNLGSCAWAASTFPIEPFLWPGL